MCSRSNLLSIYYHFQNMQRTFLEKYYHEFDDNEENKIIYTDIFKEYTALMEIYIISNLNCRMNGSFQMEKFAQELQLSVN